MFVGFVEAPYLSNVYTVPGSDYCCSHRLVYQRNAALKNATLEARGPPCLRDSIPVCARNTKSLAVLLGKGSPAKCITSAYPGHPHQPRQFHFEMADQPTSVLIVAFGVRSNAKDGDYDISINIAIESRLTKPRPAKARLFFAPFWVEVNGLHAL